MSSTVRQPLESDPQITDLVHPGDYVRSSRGAEGLVIGLQRYEYHVDGQIVAAYSIEMKP